ncbi:carbohydrate ABC transporter permease [uncultured Robinsoniella sp.]|uniref:carbohydrate ABC transporter permease n=1 Tax=uncultured Robinsoniella sp. TaxID=904190 RepID=UPI00374ED615
MSSKAAKSQFKKQAGHLKPGEQVSKWVIRIILLLFVLITVYPMLFVLLTSGKTTNDFYNNIWGFPKSIEWANYSYAWTTAGIGRYFLSSIIVAASVVVVTLILSSLAGYALTKLDIPKSDTIMIVIFTLTMLPSESVLMPMYLMISKIGILGTHLSLILPYIGWGLAFAIYIYRNFFKTVPTEIIEAARIDGCTESTTFRKVVMPMMLPATATNAIFCFLSWWGEMLWASVDLSTSSIKTLPLGITAFVQSAGTDWGPLSAASCIILLPVIFFFIFTQKYFIAGLTGGAVKG